MYQEEEPPSEFLGCLLTIILAATVAALLYGAHKLWG